MKMHTDTAQFLDTLMRMAEAMQDSGAEVYRTEDTINRIGRAYGAEETDVFAITSNIVTTVRMPGEKPLTQSRRLKSSGGNDFLRLERLNALSRRACMHPMDMDEFNKAIDDINGAAKDDRLMILGCVLTAGCFAMFYGGSVVDGIISAVIGVIIYTMQKYLAPMCLNKLAFQLCASFAAGLLAYTAGRLLPGTLPDKIAIGDIMLLVPGVMFTNSIRDMLLGDTLSGILRLIEALLLAAMMTVGYITAMLIMNGM